MYIPGAGGTQTWYGAPDFLGAGIGSASSRRSPSGRARSAPCPLAARRRHIKCDKPGGLVRLFGVRKIFLGRFHHEERALRCLVARHQWGHANPERYRATATVHGLDGGVLPDTAVEHNLPNQRLESLGRQATIQAQKVLADG